MVVDQPNTGGGNVLLSVPVKLDLRSGSNSLTFGAGQSSKCINVGAENSGLIVVPDYAADLDKIVVYQQG